MSTQVCNFYLNGNCRFGDRCWYSHERGSGYSSSPVSRNPYIYVRDQKNEPRADPHRRQTTIADVEVKEVVNRIAEEAKQVEYDHMWPFSCLGVVRNVPSVPGWEDYSMEELRSAAYSAKAAGIFHEYVKFYESIKLKAKENRAAFLRRGKEAEVIVRKMLEAHDGKNSGGSSQSKHSADPFTTFSFSSAQTSAFGSSPQFGSSSVFGNAGGVTSAPAIAAEPSKGYTPGLFAMASKNFSSTPFPASSDPYDSAMETISDHSNNQPSPFHQNIFGQVPQPSNPFGSKVTSDVHFGGPVFNGTSTSALPSVFGSPATTSHPVSASVDILAIYTPIDALTEEELREFQATTFTIGNLPLRPPPREMC